MARLDHRAKEDEIEPKDYNRGLMRFTTKAINQLRALHGLPPFDKKDVLKEIKKEMRTP